MGKAAKFKKLRRLASQLPPINLKVVKGEIFKGSDIKDIKDVDGKPIDPAMTYKRKSIEQQPLNHHRNMKRLYNKHGAKGVSHYLNAVKNFTEQKQNA